MAKITLEAPFRSIHGKINKSDNSYFASRYGQTIMTRIYSNYNGGNTEQQQAVRAKFNRVSSRVSELLADPEQKAEWEALFKAQKRYKTLRSFVFASIYSSVD